MLSASKAELTELGYQQLWTYHQLLRERNGDGDLTRIHAFESMVTLHYVDCILVAQNWGQNCRRRCSISAPVRVFRAFRLRSRHRMWKSFCLKADSGASTSWTMRSLRQS